MRVAQNHDPNNGGIHYTRSADGLDPVAWFNRLAVNRLGELVWADHPQLPFAIYVTLSFFSASSIVYGGGGSHNPARSLMM
jgi:hypothetical protein